MKTARTYFADKGEANGRCYDPIVSGFLSVDACLQDPTSAQGFNRYAYCSHNPLRYVDPTGWSNQPFGTPNVAPPCNPIKHTTYSSDDPNDMLWGYSHHPCSSGGQCNGENVTCTKITEGNGSNYTVSTTGYVTNVGSNGLDYDMLYTEADWEAGDLSNGLRVNDMSILSQLTVARSDYGTTIWEGEGKSKYEPGHYAATENKDEAFKVFNFMANNTDVEWAIDGFRTEGTNEYVVRSSHCANSVLIITGLQDYSIENQIFTMHSHQGINATKGAPFATSQTGGYTGGDMYTILQEYKRFQSMGMKSQNVWFKCKTNGKNTVFPKHYVYHSESHTLYHYNIYVSNYYIRTIKKHQDLYRNLGL